MILGLACCLVSALAYGAASVLQGLAARRVPPAGGMDPRLLGRLAGELPYLGGLALDGVAFLSSLVALRTLPLFLVQSAIAASVGVTAILAGLLGARLRSREKAALAVLGTGLISLAAAARPETAGALGSWARWALLGGVLVVGAVGALGARSTGPRSAAALATGSGLAFALVAVAARALVLPHPLWHVLTDPAAWAIAINGVLGTLLFAMALQRGSVTTATAVMFAVDTVVPAGVGLLFLGDSVRSGYVPVAAAGFVLALGGALALSSHGEAALPAAAQPAPGGAK